MQEKLHKKNDAAYDIITLGEVLIDQITHEHQDTHNYVGGSPSNIAINMQQLGANALFVGAIGKDQHGQLIQDRFLKSNVNTHLAIVDAPTSVVHINQSKDTPIPEFLRGADYCLSDDAFLNEALKTTKIFHFSYWPLTREPALTTLLKAVDTALAAGALIGFDPNLHPALTHPETISNEGLHALLKKVDFIKPSLDDAKRMWGNDLLISDYLDRFEAFDIPVIIMSLGKDGIVLSHRKKRTFIPSPTTKVVDTTGAGDAFYSGFYMSLLKGHDLLKACEDAQRVSELVLGVVGAIADLPHYHELHKGA